MAESVKGMIVKLGLDTTELRQGLKETQNELKKEQSILSSINRQMKFNTNPLDAWKKKGEQVTKVINKMNDQVADQNKVIEKTQKAVAKGLLDKSKLDAETKKLEKMTIQLGEMNQELEYTKAKTKEAFMNNMSTAMKGFGNIVKGVLTSITAVVASVAGIATATANAINSVNEKASQAGLDVESYQRLTYASSQLYVKEESLATAMTKVNGVLGDFAKGEGLESAQTLAKIGLNYEEIAKMGTEDAFYAIIDALGELEDQSLAVGYANDLFGDKLGTKLIPLMKAGSKQIKSIGSDANVITEEMTGLANEYDTLMTDMKNEMTIMGADILPMVNPILRDIVNAVRNDVAPVVKDVFKAMTDFTKSDAFESVKRILSTFGGFVQSVLPTFQKLMIAVEPLLEKFADGFDRIAFVLTAVNDALSGIIDGVNAFVNSPVGKAMDAIGSFAFQNPLDWIMGAFSGDDKKGNNTTNNTTNNTFNINTTASNMDVSGLDVSMGRLF